LAIEKLFKWPIVAKEQSLDQILPLSDIFKKNLASLKKSRVRDGSSNQKRAYKSEGILFSKCISSLSFQGTTMIHDLN
jgi:hypothetical protein